MHWIRAVRANWRRSLRASLVVGTVLTLLNQGDQLFAQHLSPNLWWKIPLTYLVPFVVATYGAAGAGPRSEIVADAPDGGPGDS